MLQIADLTYRIGGRVLFDRAGVVVPDGHKVGLVGRNGSGKTTLFNLITGELAPESGSIAVRPRARVGRVAQEAPGGPQSLLETVLAADEERTALLAEAEHAADPQRIAEAHTRLADIGAHAAPARAATILAGLGFDEAAQQRPCAEFSGGWRMRVALAAALFARPDLLLLDEPTNHLDLEATMWLESYLAGWRGTVIVISHERDLLNKAVEEIVHLEGGKLARYAGGYDRFEQTRRERLLLQEKARIKQQAQREHIQAFVDRFRYKATKARQAQSRLKMLERMEPIAAVMEEWTPSFDFPGPEPLPSPLLTIDGASVGYTPGRPVLRRLDLRLDADDRVALVGANGNGKSTLVRLVAGRLQAEAGEVRRPGKLRVGYFAQHQTEELEPDATPLDHMARLMPEAPPAKVRAHLGRFGFQEERALTRVRDLSGGEKARLLFALMTRDAPHVLLLDEPTNHLDIDAREALVQALNAYDGAVVLVSHDAHLVGLVADRIWLVADGTCRAFDGDMDDYRRLLLEQRRQERRNGDATAGGRDEKKEQRRARASLRAETAPLRQAVKVAERQLDSAHAAFTALESRLADPKLYAGPSERVTELRKQHAQAARAVEEAEEAWLQASEALESALGRSDADT